MFSRRGDQILAIVLLTIGFAVGGLYLRQPDVLRSASYYQDTMGPAVLFACGRGFSNTDDFINAGGLAAAALTGFLQRTSDAFDCAVLPAEIPASQPTALQSASRYLLTAVGLAWKVTGVSWSGLWWLFGLIYGTVAALVFLAARTVLGRGMAAGLGLLLLTSASQLAALPHLRDYAKAPFFAAMLFITLKVVVQAVPPSILIGWSVAAGVLMGLAFGVRFDMFVFLAFYIGAVVMCSAGKLRDHWRPRLTAAAIALATALVVAAPVLLSFQLGNNSWHVILLGFATPHDQALALRPSVYELGSLYNDSYVSATVNAFAGRTGEASGSINSPGYGRAAGDYYAAIARTFPADLVARALAAVVQALSLAFDLSARLPPGVEPDGLVALFYRWRAQLFSPLAPAAPVLVLIAIASIAWRSARLALLAASAVVLFGMLASMQFQVRHFFHLEVLPWLLVAVLVSGTWQLIAQRRLAPPGTATAWPRRLAATMCVLLLPVAGYGLVRLSRTYQEPRVIALLDSYVALPTEPGVLQRLSAEGIVRLSPVRAAARTDHVTSEFFLLEVGGHSCDQTEFTATARYETASPSIDLMRPVYVDVPDVLTASTTVFLSTFSAPVRNGMTPDYRFVGIDVPDAAADCVRRFEPTVGADRMPLLLDSMLPPDWRALPLHATFATWEPSAAARDRATYVFPSTDRVKRSEWAAPRQPLGTDVDYLAGAATLTTEGGMVVQGRTRERAGYLSSWRPHGARAGDLLLAEGRLETGGLTIGLQRGGQWIGQVPVTAAGRFRVSLRVAEPGDYAVVVANQLSGWWPQNRAVVDRIGWVRQPAPEAAP